MSTDDFKKHLKSVRKMKKMVITVALPEEIIKLHEELIKELTNMSDPDMREGETALFIDSFIFTCGLEPAFEEIRAMLALSKAQSLFR